MTKIMVDDVNVLSAETLITPQQLKREMPLSDTALATVENGRKAIKQIIERTDPRIFLVVGPCSIHDTKAALDYAERLKTLAHEVKDSLCLVMRVYFEKPRTTVGWKGFINDPHLNGSFDISEGLRLGRSLLVKIAEMGLPAATEALDPISPQFLQDLISWSAIGARTTESQTHREMASGLSSAVGFKNGTDGSLVVAINALSSAASPHRFLGIDHQGKVAVIRTRGNQHAHIVLRGGGGKTNYDANSVAMCEQILLQGNMATNIMIDCSHANAGKDPERQQAVMADVSAQILSGNQSIIGLMIESNISAGKQQMTDNPASLRYGVSITDACIDWASTETMIRAMRDKVKHCLPGRKALSADALFSKSA